MEFRDNNQKINFDNVDSIVFSADITNEEARLLQLLKEQHKKSLICPEAKGYQSFLKAYSSSSGYHVFRGDLDSLDRSDLVISFGVWYQDERAASINTVRKTLEGEKAKFIYMHSIEDASLQDYVTQFIKYEVGGEEGVAALLAYTLLEEKALSQELEELLEEFDIGYLSAESNVGEEELESMYGLIDEKSTVSLIVGSDLYSHPKADQIAKLIGLLEKYAGVNVVCIPPAQNALGIALICELDDVAEGQSITYESCQEGTYLNTNRCIYMHKSRELSDIDGLNSIAATIGLTAENLQDYSDQLPQDQGFQKISKSDWKRDCIYKLTPQSRSKVFTLDEIDDLPVYDGALVYTYPVEKMQEKESQKADILYGSNQFAMATKLQDRDLISFEIEGVKFTRVFKIDTHMKGVIALNPTSVIDLSASLLSSYRFSRLAFEKINNQNIGNNDE